MENLDKNQIQKNGFKVTFTNGTGAGGQKRNRTLSVAIVEHIATGKIQRCDETRNQKKNMNIAYSRVCDELKKDKENESLEILNEFRKKSKENGTIRTYNFQRNEVKNHVTGKVAPLRKVLDGKLELINSPI